MAVERCVHNMEAGLIAEIPRAKTREDGSWLERVRLLWGDIELCEGQLFSAYAIPPGCSPHRRPPHDIHF